MLNSKKIITVLLLALFSLSSHSQVYKWVDENGKVHYSDKKPVENSVENSVEINVGHNVMSPAKIIGDAEPIYFDGKDSARWVVMTQPVYSPPENPGRKKKIAHFYFGGDCGTPTSINWQQLDQQYPEVIPKNHRYFKQITNVFYDSGYQLAIVENQELARQLKSTQGHKLVATIVDMKLEACVKKVRSNQHSQNLNDFNISAFRTAQNWVQMKWMLYDRDTQELLYESETEGVSTTIERQRFAISVAIQNSLSSATKQLLSDKKFASLLAPPFPSDDSLEKPATSSPSQKHSVFEQFTDRLNGKYKRKTHFVEILTATSYLKVIATEYFARDGKWATNISDLDLKSTDLYSEDQVRSIGLRGDGTIVLDVSPTFGRNTTIWLIPTERNRGTSVSWQCQTNVDVGNNIGNCKSF